MTGCLCLNLGIECWCPRPGRPQTHPHGTLAAARRHYRREGPGWQCRACKQAEQRDSQDRWQAELRQRQLDPGQREAERAGRAEWQRERQQAREQRERERAERKAGRQQALQQRRAGRLAAAGAIREMRRRAGWTQQELAEAVGVSSRSVISDWETAVYHPAPGMLARIAEVTGYPAGGAAGWETAA